MELIVYSDRCPLVNLQWSNADNREDKSSFITLKIWAFRSRLIILYLDHSDSLWPPQLSFIR